MWDLSENFDYKTAIEDRDLVESRIHEIQRLIDDVEIITQKKSAKWDSSVNYGSVVVLRMDDGKEYTVTVVGSWEVQFVEDNVQISLESALWQSLQGKKSWEKAIMKLDWTKHNVEIIAVK
jgi:transcription elongation GreA/GreB family factor